MMSLLKKLVTDEKGQDLAEYAIALAVIGAGVAATAVLLAGDVNALWTKAEGLINGAW